jgi:hypothetical protein
MSLSSPSLRRFVRRVLVDATGVSSPDPGEIATAFDNLRGRLHRQLQPLFGRTAVDALFARALHVALTEFSWLDEVLPRGQDPSVANRLATVRPLDRDDLAEGLAAVLAHNIGLLSGFVGDDLVLPLVQQAWGVAGIETSETKVSNE